MFKISSGMNILKTRGISMLGDSSFFPCGLRTRLKQHKGLKVFKLLKQNIKSFLSSSLEYVHLKRIRQGVVVNLIELSMSSSL